MTRIKFTTYNSKTGKDVSRIANVVKVRHCPYDTTMYYLENDKVICEEPRRSEIWGKSGYLGIVENIQLIESHQ